MLKGACCICFDVKAAKQRILLLEKASTKKQEMNKNYSKNLGLFIKPQEFKVTIQSDGPSTSE